MNILVLEDSGAVSVYLTRALRDAGHQVLYAQDIHDAQHYWESRNEMPIDAMIIDINMQSNGLSEQQRKESCGGLLTGWLWLRDSVLITNPELRQRVIVYSDYLSDFVDHVSEDQYAGIFLISKKESPSGARGVLKRIHQIARAGTSVSVIGEGNDE